MTNLRSSLFALVVVVGGAHGHAIAQDQGTESSEQGGDQAGAVAKAEAVETRGNALTARIQGLLDGARGEGDIIKVNCLNRKLTEANAQVRQIADRAAKVRKAAAIGDEGVVAHELTVLSVLEQKLGTTDQEASQCVGQELYEGGAATVTTTADSNVVPGSDTADSNSVQSPPPPPAAVTVAPPNAGGVRVEVPPPFSPAM